MFNILKSILEDKNTGNFTFKAFSLCHIIYVCLVLLLITFFVCLFKNKSKVRKKKINE